LPRCGAERPLHAGEGIALREVSFRYPGKDRDSIESLSLEVEPGETIAIVGESGTGKTTLVRL
jgi:ATP-binding cassette, subfamily B, bacterial